MKKRESKLAAKKAAAKRAAGVGHCTPARHAQTGWQGALARNLRAQGYSPDEARELVEIAAS
jgi:hypothetical protein